MAGAGAGNGDSAGVGAGNGAGRPAPSDGVRWAGGAIRIVEGDSTSGGRCGSKPLPSGSPGTCAAGAAPCVYQAGGV
ncbi:hypothetical protein [Streptomyces sp. NPDC041003]|uniref:hypothetical protein n=1 Tax=Streptomyces sp. NPDC041003 TaxID=3155730 RepID=UPI0033E82ADF